MGKAEEASTGPGRGQQAGSHHIRQEGGAQTPETWPVPALCPPVSCLT